MDDKVVARWKWRVAAVLCGCRRLR